MEQRRHFFRVLFAAPASLRWAGGQSACEVHDLSLKGALVATPPGVRLATGAACMIEIPLGGDEDARITMEGIVAHHHDAVLGVRCKAIDLDSITHLRRLVELNRGDAEDLQRELSALSAE
jgi:hypothetical protein